MARLSQIPYSISLPAECGFLGVLLGIYLAATASGSDPSRSPLDESEIAVPDPPEPIVTSDLP